MRSTCGNAQNGWGEIGDDAVERHGEPAAATHVRERLDGQEMRAHHGIGGLALAHSHQAAQVEPVETQPHRRGAAIYGASAHES